MAIFLPQDYASIILHIIIIVTFIMIFFFTYGSYLEGQVIKSQMEYIVDDLVGDIKIIAPDLASSLKQRIKSIKKPNLEEEDRIVEENNRKLRNKALLVIGSTLIIGLALIYSLSKYYAFNLKDIIIVNTVSLIAVAITYFLFTTFFIASFRSADPNFVKRKLLESLKS